MEIFARQIKNSPLYVAVSIGEICEVACVWAISDSRYLSLCDTGFSSTDVSKITKMILELHQHYQLAEVVLDRLNAVQIAEELAIAGITVYNTDITNSALDCAFSRVNQ